MNVTAIIPMAGPSRDLMESCLTALASTEPYPPDVIVIDNATHPETGEFVQSVADSLRLDVEIVRNEVNRGFTAGTNQGLARLGDSHALLLNSDCRVTPDCVGRLLSRIECGDRVAAVGPVTDDRGAQSISRRGIDRGDGIKKVDTLAFFCTLLNRHALDELGPLDSHPDYAVGLGVDDAWCLKARRAGWKLLLARDAFAHHDHSETFRRLNLQRERTGGAGKVRAKREASCTPIR